MADKYDWELGKPPPRLQEHSQAKHALIADYLRQYVDVYMSNVLIPKLNLTVVDGFCGGGSYIDDLTNQVVSGSPFEILNAITDAETQLNINRRSPRTVDAEYYFIDKEKSHIAFLKNEISQSQFADLYPDKIHIEHNTFEAAVPKILNSIANKTRQRAIFILDQYAYKDVPFGLVKHILATTNSEVILTFNYDRLQAYLSDTIDSHTRMANIQLEEHLDWDRMQAYKESGNWHGAIQEQLANAIFKASGAKHITLFFIDNKDGSAYWLVHLSKVYKARDVMMGLHWKHANTSLDFSHYLTPGLFPLGYRSHQVPRQTALDLATDFDFGKESKKQCISDLSEQLPRILREQDQTTFQNLVDSVGSMTPASSAEFKAALQASLDTKELIIVSEDGKTYRRSSNQTKSSDIIRYNQKLFYFLNN